MGFSFDTPMRLPYISTTILLKRENSFQNHDPLHTKMHVQVIIIYLVIRIFVGGLLIINNYSIFIHEIIIFTLNI